jgi:hypothetical protein
MANIAEGTVDSETALRCLVAILGNNNVFASHWDERDEIDNASPEI